MSPEDKPKAVVLLSGGLDSATTLALAQVKGYDCYALSIDYGQRHRAELNAARKIAKTFQVKEHKFISIDLRTIGGSALTDNQIAVPTSHQEGIPVTYVPARNTVFLSLALGWAEVLKAHVIFAGVNAVDYSGYPDCRPEFIDAFERMANLATRESVEGNHIAIKTPLIALSKSDIIIAGSKLGIDYRQTVSCYNADDEGRACRECDSCRLRAQGFADAGLADCTIYRVNNLSV
ncbi:MAG: 7-cyano-7-deazaguanine synthase QueC [Gammaproteobacteria bacterium]